MRHSSVRKSNTNKERVNTATFNLQDGDSPIKKSPLANVKYIFKPTEMKEAILEVHVENTNTLTTHHKLKQIQDTDMTVMAPHDSSE